MISPIQWEDGGYSVILSGGRVNNFDVRRKSLGAANIQDPICRTNGTVCYDLTVSLTQNPDGSLTWILTNGNFSTSETSLISAMLTRNGTLLTKEILPPENFDRGDRLHPYRSRRMAVRERIP